MQLIKRFRVLRYRSHSGRMPPSVMLSCLALEAARPGRSVGEALDEIAQHIERRLRAAHENGELIDVRNPEDNEDRFTDRWPSTNQEQWTFIEDLVWFRRKLAVVRNSQASLAERGEALEELFGEHPGREVVKELSADLALDQPGLGRKMAPALLGSSATGQLMMAPARPLSPKPNTFFGTRPWPRE